MPEFLLLKARLGQPAGKSPATSNRFYPLSLLLLSLLLMLTCSQQQEQAQPSSGEARQAAGEEQASSGPEIVQFYANTGTVAAGEEVLLCYSVENATEVILEPGTQKLFPSPNRCISVKPARTTTYTLKAAGPDGRYVEKSLTIHVGPPQPDANAQTGLILFFTASATKVAAGTPVTVCYGTKGATQVHLQPPVVQGKPAEKFCFAVRVQEPLTLTLEASSADGRRETASLKIDLTQ